MPVFVLEARPCTEMRRGWVTVWQRTVGQIPQLACTILAERRRGLHADFTG